MDVRGYVVVPNALSHDQLQMLQAAAARQQARAVALFEDSADSKASTDLRAGEPLLSVSDGQLQRASFFDTLECEPDTVSVITNPKIAPYVLSLVERPMLEQFSLTFMFRGGEIGLPPTSLPPSLSLSMHVVFAVHISSLCPNVDLLRRTQTAAK